jgi:uncharacterized DUF497 family protein
VVTFTWDPGKAAANHKKHGVDFREAATVFDDPNSIAFPDHDHSVRERRYLILGMSARLRILVVAYTEVTETLIRIISARLAIRHERRFYEENTIEGQ